MIGIDSTDRLTTSATPHGLRSGEPIAFGEVEARLYRKVVVTNANTFAVRPYKWHERLWDKLKRAYRVLTDNTPYV
jgi:hypothetical protein